MMSKIFLGILVVLLAGFLTDMISVTLLLEFLTSRVKLKTYESVIFVCKAMLYELICYLVCPGCPNFASVEFQKC